jgi:2-polyprenyl-3-methyl-5-hydroxy-6-metoxy-1,4-benzoquinol methylase
MNYLDTKNVHITLLNLKETITKSKNFKSIKSNGCDLSVFKDREFDVVFSNSVIEHLSQQKNQKKMAEEA